MILDEDCDDTHNKGVSEFARDANASSGHERALRRWSEICDLDAIVSGIPCSGLFAARSIARRFAARRCKDRALL